MTTKRDINAIYNDYYKSLGRGKKAELTRFTRFLETEIKLEPKMMARMLACLITGTFESTEKIDRFIAYGKRRG